MAKKKAKPNFPNPNPQPPGATQEVWKRWDKKIAEHIVRLFVTGICSILYRAWSELQEKDWKRVGENCRKLCYQNVMPQLHLARCSTRTPPTGPRGSNLRILKSKKLLSNTF